MSFDQPCIKNALIIADYKKNCILYMYIIKKYYIIL